MAEHTSSPWGGTKLGVRGSVGGSQELQQSPEPTRVAVGDTNQTAAWCQQTQAVPEGCAGRCMAGGSSERQGGGSSSSPAPGASAGRDMEGMGSGTAVRMMRSPEGAAKDWESGWCGSLGVVGRWHTVFMHSKSHHRVKRAFRGNICRLKDRRLSSFSLTSLKAHLRESSGWADTGTAQ